MRGAVRAAAWTAPDKGASRGLESVCSTPVGAVSMRNLCPKNIGATPAAALHCKCCHACDTNGAQSQGYAGWTLTHRTEVTGCPVVQVFGQQHPLVLKLEAEVMAKVLSCSEPLESRGSKKSAAT